MSFRKHLSPAFWKQKWQNANHWDPQPTVCSHPAALMVFLLGLKPLVAQLVKNPPAMRETRSSPGLGRSPWRREWQPTTPVFLPGRIPRTEEPGGLSSMGSQRVRHNSDMTEQLTLSLLLELRIFVIIKMSFSLAYNSYVLYQLLNHENVTSWPPCPTQHALLSYVIISS